MLTYTEDEIKEIIIRKIIEVLDLEFQLDSKHGKIEDYFIDLKEYQIASAIKYGYLQEHIWGEGFRSEGQKSGRFELTERGIETFRFLEL